MRWRKTQLQGGAGIGKQCAGAGRNYREERVLASNELALDAITGRSGYWQAMSWRLDTTSGRSGYWQAMRWCWMQQVISATLRE